MPWKLFIDDDARTPGLKDFRYPPKGGADWIIATSSAEAIALTKEKGLPSFISFDCDLGGDDSSMRYVDFISSEYYDGPVPEYKVHSQNPVESLNVISKMNSWKKSQSL